MIDLSHDSTLWRVQIAISGFPNGAAKVERSANQVAWQTVRGGTALPISGGEGSLDDHEYFCSADGSLTTFYRVSSASLEDTVDVFTASGTWNKPSGLVAAKVTVIGGGGGGGGAEATGAGEGSVGSGGGAGVTAVAIIPAADLGSSETVTVGSGGAGGTGTDGSSGGTSTFTRTTGTNVTAGGGAGGNSSAASSGSGAIFGGTGQTTAGGEDLTLPGEYGDPTFIASGIPNLPNGGSSAVGRGGRSGSGSDGLGGSHGGGGGGTRNLASDATVRTGGAGGDGLIIVEHFFAGEGP